MLLLVSSESRASFLSPETLILQEKSPQETLCIILFHPNPFSRSDSQSNPEELCIGGHPGKFSLKTKGDVFDLVSWRFISFEFHNVIFRIPF